MSMDGRSPLSASTPRNISFLIFGLIALASSLCFIYLGWVGWPGLHWDAALYGPPVINVASGNGWIFGSYGPQVTLRPTLAYNFHGILHVFVYGVLFRADTWSRYIFAQSIVNSFTFFAYVLAYAYLLVRAYGVKLYCFIAALLLGSVAGVICIGLQGRPEQMAPLILLLPLASFSFISRRRLMVIALGISLGVLVTLSPLISVFFSVFVLFYLFGSNTGGSLAFLRTSAAFLATGFILSVMLVWILTPVSPLEWYLNVFRVSQATVNFEGLLLRLRGYRFGFTLIAPLWNVLVLFLVALGGIWLWRSKRSITSMLLFALSAAVFNEKMCDYGYSCFIPFALGLYLLESSGRASLRSSESSLRLVNIGLLLVSSAYVLVLVSYVTTAMTVPRVELSAAEAQRRFNISPAGQALASGLSAVGFPSLTTPSMVILGDASAKFVSFNPSLDPSSDKALADYEAKTGLTVDWIVYPQTFTKENIRPPETVYVGPGKFILVDSNWISPLRVDFLLRPGHLTNRNNFAIYQRIDRQRSS
jgi:hypothetical protein